MKICQFFLHKCNALGGRHYAFWNAQCCIWLLKRCPERVGTFLKIKCPHFCVYTQGTSNGETSIITVCKSWPCRKEKQLKHLQTLYRPPTEGGIILQNSYNVYVVDPRMCCIWHLCTVKASFFMWGKKFLAVCTEPGDYLTMFHIQLA